jgi:hypothetical protein
LGTRSNKKLSAEADLHNRLDELETVVKEAVANGTQDVALSLLLEITLASIHSNRPVFPTIAEEPLFYRRYIVRWIQEALHDNKDLQDAEQYGLDELARRLSGT